MRRATQGPPDQRTQAEVLRNEVRMRRSEARDARSEYLGFIKLQPALHLQRQRYEVWRLSHELAGVLPRADTRVLDPVPRALALGVARAGATRDVETGAIARQSDATPGMTTEATMISATTTLTTTTQATTTQASST
jgi:hypothetical protein